MILIVSEVNVYINIYLDFGHKTDIYIQPNGPIEYNSSPFLNNIMAADSLTSYLHNAAIAKQPQNYHTINVPQENSAFLSRENIASINPGVINPTGNYHHDNSLTFKSVGPDVDSTIDSNGVKYSQKYKINKDSEKVHNVGYYGKSRLTR